MTRAHPRSGQFSSLRLLTLDAGQYAFTGKGATPYCRGERSKTPAELPQ